MACRLIPDPGCVGGLGVQRGLLFQSSLLAKVNVLCPCSLIPGPSPPGAKGASVVFSVTMALKSLKTASWVKVLRSAESRKSAKVRRCCVPAHSRQWWLISCRILHVDQIHRFSSYFEKVAVMKKVVFSPFRSGCDLRNASSNVRKVVFVERGVLPENVCFNANTTGRSGCDLRNACSNVPKVVFLKRAAPSDISATD